MKSDTASSLAALYIKLVACRGASGEVRPHYTPRPELKAGDSQLRQTTCYHHGSRIRTTPSELMISVVWPISPCALTPCWMIFNITPMHGP